MLVVYSEYCCYLLCLFFFFKQKTAYEMRISDWSSDVCSSDLTLPGKRDRQRLLVGIVEDDQRPQKVAPAREEGDDRERDQDRAQAGEIGRASCRERVCQYV